MKKMLGPVASCGLAGVALLTGCQTTNPCGSPSPVSTTANCPPRPPLRQRLFGSVQKPGNCQTCPQLPPGSIPAGSLPPGALPSVSQNSTPTIVGQAGYGPPPVGATLPIVPGPNTTQPLAPLGVVNSPQNAIPDGNGAGYAAPINPPSVPAIQGGSGPSLGYQQPQGANPSASQIVLGPPETKSVEKQTTAKPTQLSVFPVDIPGYAVLAENIAAGQQPFPDGIQWLKQAGFDLVIHVRAPGEDDSADRSMFERAGLVFHSLELGAETFDQSAVRQISSEIRQRGSRPTFIYDRDGGRVGPLWVAYAVTVLNMGEASAREQAARLGFKPETRPEWASALQRVLGSR